MAFPSMQALSWGGWRGASPEEAKKKITRMERLKEEHLPKRDKNPKQAEAEIPFIGPLPGPSHSRSVEIGAPQQAERSEEDTECMTIAYLNVMQRLGRASVSLFPTNPSFQLRPPASAPGCKMAAGVHTRAAVFTLHINTKQSLMPLSSPPSHGWTGLFPPSAFNSCLLG